MAFKRIVTLAILMINSVVLFSQNKIVEISFLGASNIYNNHVGNEWVNVAEINGVVLYRGESLRLEVNDNDLITIKSESNEVSEKYNDYGYSIVRGEGRELDQGDYTIEDRVVVTEDNGRYAGNSAEFIFKYKITVKLNRREIEEVPFNGNLGYYQSKEKVINDFFGCLNRKEYHKAFALTDNGKWTPYNNFLAGWENFSDIDLLSTKENNYENRFNAEVLTVEYMAFDRVKGDKAKYKYDFLFKKDDNLYKIVRMLYYKDRNRNTIWYSNDPMYLNKSIRLIRLVNKPYVILQDYYDNFINKYQVKENIGKYYADRVFVHFGDQNITRDAAVYKDYSDFDKNKVKSYKIFVQPDDMITSEYERYSIVYVPVNFYIEFLGGKKVKFESKIFAVLNSAKTKIIGIDTKRITNEAVRDFLSNY